jgi:ketosteroid isomerase-like protein
MDEAKLIETTREHFEAIKNKEVERILNHYAPTEDLLVFVEGPRWATLGFENVSKGWRDFSASAINLKSCDWAENLRSKVVGKMGFVAGIAELNVEINGVAKTIRFRGTFVLQEEADGAWRVVHEHFSQPAENPYGIGDWLKK